MRQLLLTLLLLGSLSAATAADAVLDGKVVKVLPLFLDLKGHDMIAPSLYDRDAYQMQLREHPAQRSGIRYDVLWKAANAADGKLKLRVELRGIGEHSLPRELTLQQDVKMGAFRRWTSITLGGDEYKNFGEVVAWRVTLWADDKMLGEQKSFLW
jgi:hypothetical protein